MKHDAVYSFVHELLDWSREIQEYGNEIQPQAGRGEPEEEEMDLEAFQKWEQGLAQFTQHLRQTLATENDRYMPEESLQSISDDANRIYTDFIHLYKKSKKKPKEVQGKKDPHSPQEQGKQTVPPLDPVPIGKHTLPPLPYAYDALKPYISEEIMRLHHTKHHQSYVDGLNQAEEEMAKARRTGNYDLIRHWEREAAFNGAGHYLHTLFWNVMSPEGGGRPSGALAEQINQDFGSFDRFKQHFSEAAKEVEGVGWAILVWAPRAHRLEILQAEKHQLLSQWDVIPLLALDVWEHAYYLQYKNDRDSYVDRWWNIVNWEEVSDRYEVAKDVRWQPY